MTDYQRFVELTAKPLNELHEDNGVGTLSEKYLHVFLKNYFEPMKECHEVKVGRFTADICNGTSITEIQTRNFNLLREKLEYYLLEGYDVTVVHPIPRIRKLLYVDADSGEVVKKQRYRHIGDWYDAIPELYKIKYFLDWHKLTVRLMLFDVEEYRELSGGGVTKTGKARRKRSTRLERIPFDIGDSAILDNPADYLIFIPEGLDRSFTSESFARAANIPINVANMTLNILSYLHAVEHYANDGRRYLYRLNRYFDPYYYGDSE